MKVTQFIQYPFFSIGINYVQQPLWQQYIQGLDFLSNNLPCQAGAMGAVDDTGCAQNASWVSTLAAGHLSFVITLHSSFPCLHLKNNKRKHERVKGNSLGSIPFVKWTKKSLEIKLHFSIRERPWHQNMFLLSALLNILIGVVVSSACRNVRRKSYWLCDFEEGWGDGALLCVLYVHQPKIYTHEVMGLINLYS